jgi:hypothetical protein
VSFFLLPTGLLQPLSRFCHDTVDVGQASRPLRIPCFTPATTSGLFPANPFLDSGLAFVFSHVSGNILIGVSKAIADCVHSSFLPSCLLEIVSHSGTSGQRRVVSMVRLRAVDKRDGEYIIALTSKPLVVCKYYR